ncbi:hypothetical protein [Rossellomorea marisflavi]|uniref:hypothetical protein n=1 Tax=Rossellomorea marisflavi TaxID=189381 RepID=UPI003F9F5BF7
MLKRKVMNRMLLLQLFFSLSNSEEIRKYSDKQIQILVFDIQHTLRESGTLNTFNYKFVFWRGFPLSKELQSDIEYILQKGLLLKEVNVLSERAYLLIKRNHSFISESTKQLFFSKVQFFGKMENNQLIAYMIETYQLGSKTQGAPLQDILYEKYGLNNNELNRLLFSKKLFQ